MSQRLRGQLEEAFWRKGLLSMTGGTTDGGERDSEGRLLGLGPFPRVVERRLVGCFCR